VRYFGGLQALSPVCFCAGKFVLPASYLEDEGPLVLLLFQPVLGPSAVERPVRSHGKGWFCVITGPLAILNKIDL